MDLDQMEYCERGQNEEIQVKVAIADVDAYVPRQSNADRHAAHNGTSVYTGVEIFPMLPDRLSKGITSLLPGRDHLATVIEYTVLSDGNFRPGDIFRAVVSNKAKLVYEETGDLRVTSARGKSGLPRPALQLEAIRRPKTGETVHLN
jgi:exoribonuclease-2